MTTRAGRFVTGLVLAVLVGAGIGLAPSKAQAQSNYPWCAVYGNGFGGTNCGFVSFKQCMETVWGIGGFCELNNWYTPPAKTSRRKRTQS